MQRGIEFHNAAAASERPTSAPPAAKPTGLAIVRNLQTSNRYRVSSNASDPLVASTTAPRSPGAQLSPTNVSSMLTFMKKNCTSRLTLTAASTPDAAATRVTRKPRFTRYAIAAEATIPMKVPRGPAAAAAGTPKLPQKLRQHVTRLRSQFALVSTPSSDGAGPRSRSPSMLRAQTPGLRTRTTSVSSIPSRLSIAAVDQQHSRLLPKNQQRQVGAGTDPASASKSEPGPDGESSPSQKEEAMPVPVVDAGTFRELLKPLQNSLSCASLSSEWSSDEDDVEAEQLFRQSERESSQMLRVCCSLDNLLLSVGDQAQEQKHGEAIARGAARELVKLLQFAVKQVVSLVFGVPNNHESDNNRDAGHSAARLDGKEAQYAMEFLLEVMERVGRLNDFVRSALVNESDALRRRVRELESAHEAAKSAADQLQVELRDLRDFHADNNVSALGGLGSKSSPATGDQDRDPTKSETGFELSSASNLAGEGGLDVSGAGQSEALDKQCQELLRLLEMAKQEIRLSHHERDVHKARLAETTNALFRDEELSLLRNQLQSEKKRVRVLERENLTLREGQHTQTLKLHSLLASSSASTSGDTAASTSPAAPTLNRRPSNVSSSFVDVLPSSSSSSNAPSQLQQQSLGSPEEAAVLPNRRLAVDIDDGRFNFTSSALHSSLDSKDGRMASSDSRVVAGGPQPAEVNWFIRMTDSSQLQAPGRPLNKLKAQEQKPPDLATLTPFLADLLMTDKQLSVAQEQTQVRQQGNLPAVAPPAGTFVSKRDFRSTEESVGVKGSSKKRRPQSAAPVGGVDSGAASSDVEEPSDEVIASCLQLTWVFYQRFLLAEEARGLLSPQGVGMDATPNFGATGATIAEPLSLSLVVFHFFLERHMREQDATRELEQFVRCLHAARGANFELELFCQFLEDSRSREELCFLLWVRQAMDDVKMGVPFDTPLSGTTTSSSSSVGDSSLPPRQYMCLLKATFLSRTIFRLLHFKALSRPASASGTRRGKSKRRVSKRAGSGSATSPSSFSPKRRLKSRLGDELALKLPGTALAGPARSPGGSSSAIERPVPAHMAAQAALRGAIEANHGNPVTLEIFNRLLLQFAVEPSSDELLARTGPFYQPTGDERKLPVDVFLALLMEAYRFQTQWRREQLRALFVHLNQQHEAKTLEAQKLAAADGVADGGKTDKRLDSAKQQPLKSKPKKRQKSDSTSVSGVGGPGGSKYQRGLTRGVLRDLLLQSGIIRDGSLVQLDLDWLFATLLATTGGSAANIPFDVVYDALRRMRWLESREMRIDALSAASGITAVRGRGIGNSSARSRGSANASPGAIALALRENWHVHARHSLALCSNDPNVFVRRHSQQLVHYVDQQLQDLASPVSEAGDVGEFALQGIREFLIFAWRVAAKRTGDQVSSLTPTTCLTELFLVNKALRTTGDAFAGYQWQWEAPEPDVNAANSRIQVGGEVLRSFYDTRRMHLDHVADRTAEGSSVSSRTKTPAMLQELASVLARYAVHLAHLFHRFSEARFNSPARVAFHRWYDMIHELQIVHPRRLPLAKLKILFLRVASGDHTPSLSPDSAPLDQDLGVSKTQFTELFVLVALERHRVTATRKLKKVHRATSSTSRGVHSERSVSPRIAGVTSLMVHPAQVVAAFCREVLVPRAFGGDGSDNPLLERDFSAKLGCPLVGRALLEHRAFLRSVFFFYAKQDEDAEDERAAIKEKVHLQGLQNNDGELQTQDEYQQGDLSQKSSRRRGIDPDAGLVALESALDFQLEKTKRNSMSFREFQTFLREFGLLESVGDATKMSGSGSAVVGLPEAQRVFRSVMALANDDISQLEFDEFTAAVVALAVHLDPSPFTLWHEKIDKLVCRLRAVREARGEHLAG